MYLFVIYGYTKIQVTWLHYKTNVNKKAIVVFISHDFKLLQYQLNDSELRIKKKHMALKNTKTKDLRSTAIEYQKKRLLWAKW